MKFHCQGDPKSKVFLMVVFISIPIFLLAAASSGQPRFDIPTANMEIQNQVPFHLVKKIAQAKSVEKWGSGALGDPLPLCDLDGNLTAYIFPFHIGGDWFPSHEEVFARIKEGRELRTHLRNGHIEKAREKYHVLKQTHREPPQPMSPETLRALSDPQIGKIPSLRADGSRPRSFEVAEIRQMDKFAQQKAHGGEEFGAIVVSATYGRVPVPVYYHRLPSYFTRQDLAREKAEQAIGPEAALKKIYFLGMKGKVFEFANQRGKTLLHASTLESKEEEFAKFKSPNSQAQPLSSTEIGERRAKIREKLAKDWETTLTEVGEKWEGRQP